MSGGSHQVDPHDTFGQKAGLQTAVLAVLLSTFTILSHRAHTDTIMTGNEASNEWSHYQAKRIRDYQLQMSTDLIRLNAAGNPAAEKTLAGYAAQSAKYKSELEEIKKTAEEKAKASETSHHRASFFDLSEGVLDIALVITSLYFLSHKKMFPYLGLILGIAGTAAGLLAFSIH